MAKDHVIQSLVVNVVIAITKSFAAFFTGSGAMLAETIHSYADCSNQLLLLLGLNSSQKKPDSKHPLGYGRSLYFWSFVVALLLFWGGGIFSLYEGFHKLQHPEELSWIYVGILTLLVALALEGYATYSNTIEINKRRGEAPFINYLINTKDSDLIVVFGENLAASLGLICALLTQVLVLITGDTKWDAIGCIAIGIILVAVAIFLVVEIKSLLIGESADPELLKLLQIEIEKSENITDLLHHLSIQQGPGEIIVLLKLAFKNNLSMVELTTSINSFEDEIRSKRPDIKWCFIEPDIKRI